MLHATMGCAVSDPKLLHDLTITIVDKLLIGILLLLAGFVVNRALERFKSREAFLSEYSKRHVDTVSTSWSLLYAWELEIKDSVRFLMTMHDDNLLYEELIPIVDRCRQASLEIRRYVETNRFWLGEEIYARFKAYYNDLESYIDAVARSDRAALVDVRAALQKKHEDMLSVLHLRSAAFA
jgi:hypothetical protein